MHGLRVLLESHFGLVLLAACAAGLMFPALSHMPDHSASIALAMLTYASCFKLKDGGFSEIRWSMIARFYVARYILLPMVLFVIAHTLVPEYALGVFLLALVPAAVSSPAFSHMFSGAVPPAFAIVITSQLMAPFLIPFQFSWASDVAMDISPLGLFRTLAFCIFVPMVLYFFTRQLTRWGSMMYDNMKLISIVLVAFVIALVIAKQREMILADISGLLLPFAVTVFCYAVFLAAGFWLGRKQPRDVQIAYATCSGFNNVALGVSLALLHFPAKIILFVAVSEVAWSMLPIAIKKIIALRADASLPPVS